MASYSDLCFDSYSEDFEVDEGDLYVDEDFEAYSSTASEESEKLARTAIETVEREHERSRLAGGAERVEKEKSSVGHWKHKDLPPIAVRILVDRIRSSQTKRHRLSSQEQRASKGAVTYSALLPNIQRESRESRFKTPPHSNERDGGELIVQQHIADRLRIESLTLSMKNYRADVEKNMLFQPTGEASRRTGIRRMVEVVKRKTDEPVSAEKVDLLYGSPVYLVADLARSQRKVFSSLFGKQS